MTLIVLFLIYKQLKPHSLSSQIFCASVQKAMLGSSRWNKAQDLERKLGPWKHARVMWLPWRLIEPPSCTASSGRGIWKREMWQPAMTFSTPGQWRWWAASMSAGPSQDETGIRVKCDWRTTCVTWSCCLYVASDLFKQPQLVHVFLITP